MRFGIRTFLPRPISNKAHCGLADCTPSRWQRKTERWPSFRLPASLALGLTPAKPSNYALLRVLSSLVIGAGFAEIGFTLASLSSSFSIFFCSPGRGEWVFMQLHFLTVAHLGASGFGAWLCGCRNSPAWLGFPSKNDFSKRPIFTANNTRSAKVREIPSDMR
jgi:hypothetical protein